MLTDQLEDWLSTPQKATTLNDVAELSSALGSTVGEVRKDNQDRVVIARYRSATPDQSFLCALLCDGMGGMLDGAKCAEIAVSVFLVELTRLWGLGAEQRVRSAAAAANAEVHRRYRGKGGATLVAIAYFSNGNAGVSVGDSRIYALDRASRSLKQISIDDTIQGELDKISDIDIHKSRLNPFANQLTQFVGIGSEIVPRTYPIDGRSEFLLTSDGVHSMTLESFQKIATAAPSPSALVTRLLQVSRWCGGDDNASVAAIGPAHVSSFKPRTFGDDWLEIWGTVGKLEITAKSASSAMHKIPAPPQTSPDPKTRTRAVRVRTKRAPSKGKRQPVGPVVQPRDLEIQIDFPESKSAEETSPDSDKNGNGEED